MLNWYLGQSSKTSGRVRPPAIYDTSTSDPYGLSRKSMLELGLLLLDRDNRSLQKCNKTFTITSDSTKHVWIVWLLAFYIQIYRRIMDNFITGFILRAGQLRWTNSWANTAESYYQDILNPSKRKLFTRISVKVIQISVCSAISTIASWRVVSHGQLLLPSNNNVYMTITQNNLYVAQALCFVPHTEQTADLQKLLRVQLFRDAHFAIWDLSQS